eukprot:g446.t1
MGNSNTVTPNTLQQQNFKGPRFQGVCSSWKESKGFGFVKKDGKGSEEYLVFSESIVCDTAKNTSNEDAKLVVGQRCEFSIKPNEDKSSRQEATDVVPIDTTAEPTILPPNAPNSTMNLKRKSVEISSERCKDFSMGRCFRGMACKFVHEPPLNVPPPAIISAKRAKTTTSAPSGPLMITSQQLMANVGVRPMYGRAPMGIPSATAANALPLGAQAIPLAPSYLVPTPLPPAIPEAKRRAADPRAAAAAAKDKLAPSPPPKKSEKKKRGLFLADDVKIKHSRYPCAVQVDHLHGPETLFGQDLENLPNFDLPISQRMKLRKGSWLPPLEKRVLLYFSALHDTDDARELEKLVKHLGGYKDGRAGVVNFNGNEKHKLHLIPPGKFQRELLRESLPKLDPLEFFLVIGHK